MSSPWPRRLIALAVIVLIHAVVFHFIATQRAKTAASADGRQAFTPVERQTGGSSGSLAEGRATGGASDTPPPESHWRFEPLDIWPGDATGAAPSGNTLRASLQGPEGETAAYEKSSVTIKSWVPPEYPRPWAKTGEDGSVVLDVHIDEQGKPTEVKVLNSSASARIEKAAQTAVSSWLFSPPAWRAQPMRAWAEVTLRFNAYRYQLSFIDEPLPDGANPDVGTKPISSDEEFRGLLRALSNSKPTMATLVNTQPDFQKMRTTIIKWGPAKTVRLLNPQETVWREYVAKPEFRSNSVGGTIAVRWDLYDVLHEHVHARWKVAVDPYGRIWAAKADTL